MEYQERRVYKVQYKKKAAEEEIGKHFGMTDTQAYISQFLFEMSASNSN
jgi:hypothetical protein